MDAVVCRDDGDEALLLTSTKIQLSQITILKQESDSRLGGKRMPPATRAPQRSPRAEVELSKG